MRMGQTHVHRYMRQGAAAGRHGLDPSFVITHRLRLDEAPYAYEIIKKKAEGCVKIVLRP